MKFILLLGAMCYLNTQCYAQERVPVSEISIGNTVPDFVFHHIINYPVDSARLSDFKGKLVILDFWATWCSPCVSVLPKMQCLQQQFKNNIQIIAVTNENNKRIKRFIEKYKAGKDLNSILFVTDDSILSQYFKHISIPHEVWLGADGKVKAITTEQYVNADNINMILNNEIINWPIKDAKEKINYDISLFNITESIYPKNLRTKLYSGLTGYVEGTLPGAVTTRDSANETSRYTVYNSSILTLYSLAVDHYPLFVNPKRCILNVSNKNKYIYWDPNSYRNAWERKNCYCYESLVALSTSREVIRRKMKEDLDFYFHLNSELAIVKVPCLVLKRADDFSPSSQNGIPSARVSYDQGKCSYQLQNEPLLYLIEQFNSDRRFKNLPLIIDETQYKKPIDIKLSLGVESQYLSNLKASFKKYGLNLELEERKMEMLILTENEQINKNTPQCKFESLSHIN